GREADLLEDRRDGRSRLRRTHPVEAGGVREVLGGRHLLEEARLDGDAVDQPADRLRVAEGVVAEDPRLAGVVDEERRQKPDERRLSRPVLAEHGDALAAFDAERDALERRHPPLGESALLAVAPLELLVEVDDLDGRHAATDGRAYRCGCCAGGHAAPCETGWIRRTGDRRTWRRAALSVARGDRATAAAR